MDNRLSKNDAILDLIASLENTTSLRTPVGILTSSYNYTTTTTTTTTNGTEIDNRNDAIFAYDTLPSLLALSFTSIVTAVTITGNLMVLLAFYVERPLREKHSNYLLASMAASDLLLGATSCNQYAVYSVLGYWPFGQTYCHIWFVSAITFVMVTQQSALVIALDRFLGIKYSHGYRIWRTKRKVLVTVFLIWAHCLVIVGVAYNFWLTDKEQNFDRKRPRCSLVLNPAFSVVLLILCFWIRLVAIAVLYRYLYIIASKISGNSPMSYIRKSKRQKRTSISNTMEVSQAVESQRDKDTNQNWTSGGRARANDHSEIGGLGGFENRWVMGWNVMNGFKSCENNDICAVEDEASVVDSCVSSSKNTDHCGNFCGKKNVNQMNTLKLINIIFSSKTSFGPVISHTDTARITNGTNISASGNIAPSTTKVATGNTLTNTNNFATSNTLTNTNNFDTSNTLTNTNNFATINTLTNTNNFDTSNTLTNTNNFATSNTQTNTNNFDTSNTNSNAYVIGSRTQFNFFPYANTGTKTVQDDNAQRKSGTTSSKSTKDSPIDPDDLQNPDSLAIPAVYPPEVGSAQYPDNASGASSEHMKGRMQKAVRTVTCILAAYTISYGPFALFMILKTLFELPYPQYVFEILYWMNHLNSCVNPLMYAYANPLFKVTFYRILLCDWQRNNSRSHTMVDRKQLNTQIT